MRPCAGDCALLLMLMPRLLVVAAAIACLALLAVRPHPGRMLLATFLVLTAGNIVLSIVTQLYARDMGPDWRQFGTMLGSITGTAAGIALLVYAARMPRTPVPAAIDAGGPGDRHADP